MGENQRIGLHGMFLVKNNHIDRVGSVTAAVERLPATNMQQKKHGRGPDARDVIAHSLLRRPG